MSRSILVLLGPNLKSVLEKIENEFEAENTEFTFVQANSEGLLIDALESETFDGILVNVGSIAPLCFALAEAVLLTQKPCVEVLLKANPPERGTSALSGVSLATVIEGHDGHQKALAVLLEKCQVSNQSSPVSLMRNASAPKGKTIGRRSAIENETTVSGKSIGSRSLTQASNLLTKQMVAQKIHARLKDKISVAELSSWARTQWQSLQNGGPCEESSRSLIDTVLLTLMAGSKVSDDMLLSQVAKLER